MNPDKLHRWILLGANVGSCYHQTWDAWGPGWDLRGAAQDVEVFRLIVADLANSTRRPQWKPGSEFKAIREQSNQVRNVAGTVSR